MFFLEAILIAQNMSGRFSLAPDLQMTQLQNFVKSSTLKCLYTYWLVLK